MVLSQWDGSKMRFLPLSVRSVVKCSSLESNSKGHGSCSMTDDTVFFNPNDRGVKRTREVWVTLTYDINVVILKMLCRMSGGSLNVSWRMLARSLTRFNVVESPRLLRMVIRILEVS
jgi:hypothetical protein